MADCYFRINERTIALPEDPGRGNQMNPLERRKNGGEKKNKRERLTTNYWGLDRRRRGEDKKILTILEEQENTKEHLTATYWG